jgi:lipopolysaccharide transport system ATP-binding protein
VLRLCERAILLNQGRVVSIGPTHEVVRAYLESDLGRTSERRWDDPSSAPGDEVVRLRSIRVVPARGGRGDEVDIREPIDIEVEYWSAGPAAPRPSVNLLLFNSEGVCLFTVSEFSSEGWRTMPRRPGLIRSTCRIPGNFLAEGRVTVNVNVATYNPNHDHASEADAIAFQVVDRTEGDGVRGEHAGEWPGVMRPMLDWTVEFTPDP